MACSKCSNQVRGHTSRFSTQVGKRFISDSSRVLSFNGVSNRQQSIVAPTAPMTAIGNKGKKRSTEALWRDLFSNTSEWWDHRPEKINPRFPDFKHKQTQESLWLGDARNPSWVQAGLDGIPPGALQSNVFAWSERLRKLVKEKQYTKAIGVFHQMQWERICPDNWTFVSVLNACTGLGALDEGRRVHSQIVEVGCESDIYVATGLLDMYAKCGSIEDAWSVFVKIEEHNVVTWNAMIGGYVKSGKGLKAMELFQKMQQEGVGPDIVTFVRLLNACASVGALEEGRLVHTKIIQVGWESNVYVATCLVDMYAKCGSIDDAWGVFNKMRKQDVVTWSVMIRGYVKSGQGRKAMGLFQKMQQEGVEPDAVTFVGVLSACASEAALEEGRRVHRQMTQIGCDFNVNVATCLVDMYVKCGSIQDAWGVFNKMRKHNVITWSVMIAGYVKSGQGLKAMELFQEMQQERVEPDSVTFIGVLNACASVAALEEGRRVHTQIIQVGCESDVHVANCLVDMYAKCGSIEDAWSVFEKMQEHNVITWSAIIVGYAKSGQGLKAMKLFQLMQQEGVKPNAVTFIGVLNACASLMALGEGKSLHTQIIQVGCESDLYVANCLVNMYAKCGSMEDAWIVFNKMPKHNVVTWNAMIGGYVKSGLGVKVMELFREMQQEGVEPDAITFIGVLNACASVADLGEGRGVHTQIIRAGCESDFYVANSLIDMYAKCGSVEDAASVFIKMRKHNVVSCNAMIGGYVKSGQGLKAIKLFQEMQQERIFPDSVTFIGVLNACANVAALEEGRRVHTQIIEIGCESDVYVANCLVNMYAKCGSIEDAFSVFNNMREHNVVTWNSMIRAYAMHGQVKKAIGLFQQMQKGGVEIDGITFICLLSACSHGGLVKEGVRYFQSMTSCFNLLPTLEHYACMVDLLGRAGQLVEAGELMKRISYVSNLSMWMSLLGACRTHGYIEMAEHAAKRCWELDLGDTLGHVILSNIYAAAGKWDRIAAIEAEGLKRL